MVVKPGVHVHYRDLDVGGEGVVSVHKLLEGMLVPQLNHWGVLDLDSPLVSSVDLFTGVYIMAIQKNLPPP